MKLQHRQRKITEEKKFFSSRLPPPQQKPKTKTKQRNPKYSRILPLSQLSNSLVKTMILTLIPFKIRKLKSLDDFLNLSALAFSSWCYLIIPIKTKNNVVEL